MLNLISFTCDGEDQYQQSDTHSKIVPVQLETETNIYNQLKVKAQWAVKHLQVVAFRVSVHGLSVQYVSDDNTN